MYAFLGLCVTLAAFLGTNLAASLAVAALTPLLLRRRGAPEERSARLLALRLLPAALAIVIATLVVLPAYLLLEPAQADERAPAWLVLVAAAGLAVIGAAAWRGVAAGRATRRVVRDWMRSAQPVVLDGAGVPAYRIEDSFPVVSVVGTRDARLFVAGRVLDALSPREAGMALAHESAHLAARDNLKRWALRVTPDLLTFLPAGRRLEREWLGAAETAADARAAAGDPRRALDLGAALLKVAALAVGPRVDVLASALDDGGEIAARVRRLVETPPAPGGRSRRVRWRFLVAGALAAASALWVPAHHAIEAGVALFR
jgi:Zn-dependent protease with chaperone function